MNGDTKGRRTQMNSRLIDSKRRIEEQPSIIDGRFLDEKEVRSDNKYDGRKISSRKIFSLHVHDDKLFLVSDTRCQRSQFLRWSKWIQDQRSQRPGKWKNGLRQTYDRRPLFEYVCRSRPMLHGFG